MHGARGQSPSGPTVAGLPSTAVTPLVPAQLQALLLPFDQHERRFRRRTAGKTACLVTTDVAGMMVGNGYDPTPPPCSPRVSGRHRRRRAWRRSPQRAVLSGANDAPLTATVPVDPQITVGTLPNGLRYYVRANKQPQERAELRLVVNAGSVLEDDDQRGLAHFVEHMAFNGTRHFPKQDVVALHPVARHALRRGRQRVHQLRRDGLQLQVPTDSPAVLDRALLILEDWAHNVSFEPPEIDKERGVVLEEWRLGLGRGRADAGRAVAGPAQGLALRRAAADRQARRSSRTSTDDRLKQFYTDWYRPDLMAVIVVGDFDPAAIEALIKSHFSRHSGRDVAAAAAATTCPSTGHALRGRDRQGSDGDHRQRLQHDGRRAIRPRSAPIASRWSSSCSRGMLSDRFDEIAQKPDAPFLGADTAADCSCAPTEATTLSALVSDGGVERGLDGALHRGRARRAVRLHARPSSIARS